MRKRHDTATGRISQRFIGITSSKPSAKSITRSSHYFLLAHQNVRSITLDLKRAEAQEVARRLASEADVVVQNFRPGVVDRFGLDYETLHRDNPRLIYASVSGYGEESPERALPGQDLLIQAMAGLMAINGHADDPPTPVGAAIVDQHGAALLAMGVLAALLHRERTGEGQKLEVTMVQVALDPQLEPAIYHLNGAPLARPRHTIADTFHAAPYGFYRTADGYLALSMMPVSVLSEALGGVPALTPFEAPELATAKREEIAEILIPILRSRTTEEWIAALRERGIWCAPINGYDQVFADEAIRFLDSVLEIDHPEAGHVRLLKHPIRYGAGEPAVRHMPPALGEHTVEVLREAGYSPAEIEQLRAAGAFWGKSPGDDVVLPPWALTRDRVDEDILWANMTASEASSLLLKVLAALPRVANAHR